MPRNAPRTQPPRAPGDQAYGERGAQIASQQAMPLPERRDAAPTGPAPRTDPQQVLAAAQAMGNPLPPGGLAARTERPNEPITAGLPSGPGTNTPPPALRRPTGAAVSKTLLMLAEVTGQDSWADLALAARNEGR